MTNVLIVEDSRISREAIERKLTGTGEYAIAAAIENAANAEIFCLGETVDLVLMDIVMNDGSNGLDAAARIKTAYPSVKIIAVTSMPDSVFLKRAREIGVDSFWYKEAQSAPMLEIMDRTMAGEHIFPDSPPVTRFGLAENTELTERELDVLRLLAQGLTDREICETLHMSSGTVRYHLSNLLDKTGYSSRTELAVNAVRSGIALPGGR